MGLLNLGKFRIGTLSDYRRSEHAPGISDPSEGIKKITHQVGIITINSKEWTIEEKRQAKILSDFGLTVVPGSGAHFAMYGGNLRRRFEEDAFAFCFSIEKKPSLNTMRQFEGADCCLEIVQPEQFFQLLLPTIAQLTGAYRVISPQAVEYRERTDKYREKNLGLHPGLIKEPQFRQQNEGRILWQLPQGSRTYVHFISGHCQLGAFCKVIDLKSL